MYASTCTHVSILILKDTDPLKGNFRWFAVKIKHLIHSHLIMLQSSVYSCLSILLKNKMGMERRRKLVFKISKPLVLVIFKKFLITDIGTPHAGKCFPAA